MVSYTISQSSNGKRHSTIFNIIQRILHIGILLEITWLIGQKYGPLELIRHLAIYGSLMLAVVFSFFNIYKSWRETTIASQITTLFFAWLSVLIIFNAFILLLCNEKQFEILCPFVLLRTPVFQYWALYVFLGLAMARPLRVEYPGGFYHVTNRGNAGDDIFI